MTNSELWLPTFAAGAKPPDVAEETWDSESIQWIRDAAAKDPEPLSWTVELFLVDQQKTPGWAAGAMEARIRVQMNGPNRYMNALLVDPEPLRENLKGIPLSSPADHLADRISEIAAERLARS